MLMRLRSNRPIGLLVFVVTISFGIRLYNLLLNSANFSKFVAKNQQGYIEALNRPEFKLTVTQPTPDTGPRNNVLVYIKIEKTGSSTLSNIFYSYGYRHKLNMIMSTLPGNLINTRELKPGSSWDIGPQRSPVHLMVQHARYSDKFFDKYFPDDNTTFITSVREPIKFFISFVDFMKVYRGYDPRQVLNNDQLFHKQRDFVTGMQQTIHNVYLQWLGFEVQKSGNVKLIDAYIRWIDSKFKLVMITEYFDESLVLLKRIMNWDLGDIFYQSVNEAVVKSGVVLTEEEKEKLLDKRHNGGDKLLYDHFNRTLWDKVANEIELMEEVAVFRVLNKKVVEFCNSNLLHENPLTVLELSTKWDGQFNVSDSHCTAIRLVSGRALELGSALDHYIPHRKTKRVSDLSYKRASYHTV